MARPIIEKEDNELEELLFTKNVFVDRKDYIELFEKEFSNVKETKGSSAIYYWGISGIGKSSLLNHLRKTCDDRESPTAFITLESANVIEILYQLSVLIQKNEACKSFMFYTFYSALLKYQQLCGISHDFYNADSVSGEGEKLFKIVCDYVKDLPIPGSETFVKLVKGGKGIIKFGKFFDKIDKWYIEKKQKEKAERFYKLIDNADKADMLYSDTSNVLIDAFVFDFNYNMKRNYDNTNPLTIFIDKYELYNDVDYTQKYECNPKWLFGEKNRYTDAIAYRLLNVVWVVSGQDHIAELEFKDDNGYLINRTSINEKNNGMGLLEEEDVKEWLESLDIGMSNQTINKIYSVTEGLPAYVSVCLDLYVSNNGNVDEDEFDGKFEDIVNRYLTCFQDKYPESLNMIKLLATIGEWSEKDIKEILKDFNGDNINSYQMSLNTYERICRKSYITYDGNKRRIFHEKVREMIFNSIKYGTIAKHDNYLLCLKHFERKLEDKNIVNTYSYYLKRLKDLVINRGLKDKKIDTRDNILDLSEDSFLEAYDEEFTRTYEIIKKYYYFYRDYIEKRGNYDGDYSRAIEYSLNATDLAVIIEYLNNEMNKNKTVEMTELNYLYCRLLPLILDKETAVIKIRDILNNLNPEQIKESVELYYEIANIYYSLGEFNSAIEYIQKVAELCEKNNCLGCYDFIAALKLCGFIYLLLGTNQTTSNNNLRRQYLMAAADSYEKALQWYEYKYKDDSMYKALLLKDNADIAYFILKESNKMLDYNQQYNQSVYNYALEQINKAYALSKQISGDDNAETVRIRQSFMKLLLDNFNGIKQNNDFDEMINKQQEVIEMIKNRDAINHEMIRDKIGDNIKLEDKPTLELIQETTTLALLKKKRASTLDDNEKVEALNEVLEIQEQIFNNLKTYYSDSLTAEGYPFFTVNEINMANTYYELGNINKYLEYIEDVYKTRCEYIGDTDLNQIMLLNNLCNICKDNNNEQKFNEIVARLKEIRDKCQKDSESYVEQLTAIDYILNNYDSSNDDSQNYS